MELNKEELSILKGLCCYNSLKDLEQEASEEDYELFERNRKDNETLGEWLFDFKYNIFEHKQLYFTTTLDAKRSKQLVEELMNEYEITNFEDLKQIKIKYNCYY